MSRQGRASGRGGGASGRGGGSPGAVASPPVLLREARCAAFHVIRTVPRSCCAARGQDKVKQVACGECVKLPKMK